MKIKHILFWGSFLFFFLLTGCSEGVNTDTATSEVFTSNPSNCWPCDIYMQVFKAIDSVLDASLENVANNSMILLEMGFLFWLLIKASTLLMSFSKPDIKKEIASFATISFKFLIVFIFLHTPTYIYDFFGSVVLQPMGGGFLSLSETVLKTPQEVDLFDILPSDLSDFLKRLQDRWDSILGHSTSQSVTTSRMFGGLAVEIYQIIYQIFAQLWHGMGLGFQLIAAKDWSAFFAALILIAGLGYLLLLMPLYFIDAFLRIGLLMILMPLLMVGWVFSYPKGLVKNVITTLFSGFFDILFNCIYIMFLVTLLRVYQGLRFAYLFSDSYHTIESGLRTMAIKFTTNFLIITVLIWAMVGLAKRVQEISKFFFSREGKYDSFSGVAENFRILAAKAIRVGVKGASAVAGAVVKKGFNINKERKNEGNSEGRTPGEGTT